MVLIAASLGAVLYLALGISALTSAVAGLGALTAMALYNTVSSRLRDRGDVGDQIADLSRGTADLARQVGELGRRLNAVEQKLTNQAIRPAAESEPLAAEISELGTLVKQIAETVATHDAALKERPASAPIAAASTPAAGAAPTKPIDVESDALNLSEADAVGGPRRFRGLSRDGIAALIAAAVDANRIDLYLQPIVTLPQRKVRFYEAMSRLRTNEGDVVPAGDFIDIAEASGLMPKIDNLLLFRCVQVVRRLQLKNREVGLFCNVSDRTLSDPVFFKQFLDFMEANKALAGSLTFEFSQRAYRDFGPIEHEGLAALYDRGFRFSMDHISDLRMEPKELSDRGFRFLKVPAKLLLGRGGAQSDIHPADLADLLARSGIDLIAERIESESMVVDLLDYDVRFGQGFLFSPPRPVRQEALQSAAGVNPEKAEGAAPELTATR
jgi:cyclic-di-GMP phosphodiesterase TipF (flagellum assembly factor)